MTRRPDSADQRYDYAAALRRIIDLIVDTLDNYANAGLTIDWPPIHDSYVRLAARARLLATRHPQVRAPLDELLNLMPTLYDTAPWQDVWDIAWGSGESLQQKAYAVKAAALTVASRRPQLSADLSPADERLIKMAIDVNSQYRNGKGAKLAELYAIDVPRKDSSFVVRHGGPHEPSIDAGALGHLDATRCEIVSHALARLLAMLSVHHAGGRLTRGLAARVVYAQIRSLADANALPIPALAKRVRLLTNAYQSLIVKGWTSTGESCRNGTPMFTQAFGRS